MSNLRDVITTTADAACFSCGLVVNLLQKNCLLLATSILYDVLSGDTDQA